MCQWFLVDKGKWGGSALVSFKNIWWNIFGRKIVRNTHDRHFLKARHTRARLLSLFPKPGLLLDRTCLTRNHICGSVKTRRKHSQYFFRAKAGRFRRDIHNISTGIIQYPACQLMLKSTICKNVEQLDTVQSCPVLITQVWLESKWTPLQGPPAKIALKFYSTVCLHNWPRPPAFMRSKPLEHLSEICQRRFFAS